MVYDGAPQSILNALVMEESAKNGKARPGPSIPERRFLARTAHRRGWSRQDVLRVLGRLLGDESCDVRAESYQTLIRSPELHGEPLLHELEQRTEDEPWVQIVRLRLLRIHAAIDVGRVLALLQPAAAFGITWVEREVTGCLSICWSLEKSLTWDTMEDWLRHRSAHVREIAVRFISSGHWPEEVTAPVVFRRVVEDPSSLVRASCARGMSLWAREDLDVAIPALKALSADRSHSNVRTAVVRGMTHWRKAAPYEALDILLPLLRDVVCSVRRSAARQFSALRQEFANLTVTVPYERLPKDATTQHLPHIRSASSREPTGERRKARSAERVTE